MRPDEKYEQNERNGEHIITNGFCMPSLIMKKRDGGKLSRHEIEYFIRQVVKGNVQDGQLGAMLMAMFIRDLDDAETASLTKAMTHSGDVLRWPKEWKGSVVDKHSTGGVGDKVSLVLAPALAACGVKVPMVSGRGLGHTGGTLDKLESIPGFNVSLSYEEMLKVLEAVGCCIVGQTSNLVPADKILYATRDVTSTTENIGLITSSIISKKVAESLDSLVLDVKFGQGAFCDTVDTARRLATRMVKAGNRSGVKTEALLTDMNSPLGYKIGNALEVAESIDCLHGKGPKDLTELVKQLGGRLLASVNKAQSLEEAYNMIEKTLHDGSASAKFSDMMKAQGVNADVADKLCAEDTDVFQILPKSEHITEIKAKKTGYVHGIDAMKCAIVSGKLGAGRTKAGEAISPGVGLTLSVQIGDRIEEGNTWVAVHHNGELPVVLLEKLRDAIDIQPDIKKPTGKVLEVITESVSEQ